MPSQAFVNMTGASQPPPQNLYTISSVYSSSLRRPASCISEKQGKPQMINAKIREATKSLAHIRNKRIYQFVFTITGIRQISCVPLLANNPLPFLQRCVSSFQGVHIPGQLQQNKIQNNCCDILFFWQRQINPLKIKRKPSKRSTIRKFSKVIVPLIYARKWQIIGSTSSCYLLKKTSNYKLIQNSFSFRLLA